MKKVKRVLLFVLVLGTLISYASVLVSPEAFKFSAGISILIPVFLLLNVLALVIFAVKRSVRLLLPLGLLALGYPFFQVSYGTSASRSEEGDFSLASYNVKWFVEGKGDAGENIFDFIGQLSADIICMQEFHNEKRNIRALDKHNEYEVVVDENSNNLAIFSRFKVLKSGVLFQGKRFNNIQFADILINPSDTLRVYNLHLQSMGINASSLNGPEGIRQEYEDVKARFLDGAAIRAGQIEVLMNHMDDCDYPMLIAGDFNDVPYSYNYFRFRRRFHNAFEKAGSGLGATYNGRLPFLRIDHQFFSRGINVVSFSTINHARYSDHFPVLGIYSISD